MFRICKEIAILIIHLLISISRFTFLLYTLFLANRENLTVYHIVFVCYALYMHLYISIHIIFITIYLRVPTLNRVLHVSPSLHNECKLAGS